MEAVGSINLGTAVPSDFEESLASISSTYRTTAVLEAGRKSLDGKKTVEICYDDIMNPCRPTRLV